MKRPKRPRDTNHLAKSIVDLAVGDAEEEKPDDSGKDPAAVALGRKGGLKGGKARAKALTSEQRAEIAERRADEAELGKATWRGSFNGMVEVERNLKARVQELKEALVEAAIPLEVIAGQQRVRPYSELSPGLLDQIEASIEVIYDALNLEPGEKQNGSDD